MNKKYQVMLEIFGFGNKKHEDKVFGEMTINKDGEYRTKDKFFKGAAIICREEPTEEHYDLFEIVKRNLVKILTEATKKQNIIVWLQKSSIKKSQDVADIMILRTIYLSTQSKDPIHLVLDFPENIDPEHQLWIDCDKNGKIITTNING